MAEDRVQTQRDIAALNDNERNRIMASSVREKVVEQIRAAKRAMRDAETVVKTKFVRARDEKGG